MKRPDLKIEKNIAIITLRAVTRKNAVDRQDLKFIANFLTEIKDEKLKCLIFSGEGDTFSSGMYLDELTKGDWRTNPISEVCDLIEKLPFISICFINGGIYGGAVELALSCDFRVGSRAVKLKIPAAKFGIHYGVKGMRRCIDIFGWQISRKILFLGQSLEYKELIEHGFLDYYAEDASCSRDILNKTVEEISQSSLDAIRDMKATLNDLRNDNIDYSIEESRFTHGFKTGIVAKRLEAYKRSRKEK